jgi:predicted heme/steroid binding protein
LKVPGASFTLRELSAFDGRKGRTYVAVGGVVFDVSGSPEWRGGLHRNLHWAGQDLTSYLPDAPHGMETIERYPVVGVLSRDEDAP